MYFEVGCSQEDKSNFLPAVNWVVTHLFKKEKNLTLHLNRVVICGVLGNSCHCACMLQPLQR